MEEKNDLVSNKWKEPKTVLMFLGAILLAVVVVVSILRDRIVDDVQNQVSVVGRGEITYQPDTAIAKLGVQIDKASSAEEALNKMNEKMNSIISAVEGLGVAREDITTQNYSLYPQYDYKEGSSNISGYGANQQILVKVSGIDKNPDNLTQTIAAASKAGTNQVLGIDFEISDLNSLKQEARILAIKDARSKAGELAKAAGIGKLGKVMSWYENFVSDPSSKDSIYAEGLGAGRDTSSVSPNIPTGGQKIVIEMNLQYEVK